MQFVKAGLLLLAAVLFPGLAQILAGLTSVGMVIATVAIGAKVTLRVSTSPDLAEGAFAGLVMCTILSVALYFRRCRFVPSRGRGLAIIGAVVGLFQVPEFWPAVRLFTVTENGMAPNLVAKTSIMSRQVKPDQLERGDVIVFKRPLGEPRDSLGRVVGLPGDHIQMWDGTLFVNGIAAPRERIGDFQMLDGEHVAQYIERLPNGRRYKVIEVKDNAGVADDTSQYVVPEGHVFVLGDNRDNSKDSRFLGGYGYVPFATVGYRATWIVLPSPRPHDIDGF